MKPITGKQLARLLERNGWRLLRVNGSHHIYGKAGFEARLSVPIHGNEPLKTGLARHLAKLAGIDLDEGLWVSSRRGPCGLPLQDSREKPMPSPEAEAIIAEMKARPRGPLPSLEEERSGWEAYARTLKLPEGTLVSGVGLNGVPCEWVERAESDGLIIVLVHGGGFNSGSPRTHRQHAARLAEATGARVLLPDYALAPEEPFPAGLDDIVAVYAALAEQGIEPGDIVFLGDSSGGGLALAALVKLREVGAPMPRALVLQSPWVDLTLGGGSHASNAQHPNPSREDLDRAARWYAPAERHREPMVSPIFADLSGLPPMLVQVGGHEVLLDDSVRLAERAEAAAVPVTLTVAPGLWHVYQHSDCPEARDAIEEVATFINRVTPGA